MLVSGTSIMDTCIFESTESTCGVFSRKKLVGTFLVEDLKDSMNEYLCKISVKMDSILTEAELIGNRGKRTLQPTDRVCAKHRYSLGLYWKPPKICLHPLHKYQEGSRNKRKTPALRPMTEKTRKQVEEVYNCKIPIAAQICTDHRKFEDSRGRAEKDVYELAQMDTDEEFLEPPQVHIHEQSNGPNEYVIARCGEKLFVGLVQQVDSDKDQCEIQWMTYSASGRYFSWPEDSTRNQARHTSWQNCEDVLYKLSAPDIDRREHYIFTNDSDLIKEHFHQ
ncbi:Uncharacterised protein r2_g4032 [Pycnogonum litorale]